MSHRILLLLSVAVGICSTMPQALGQTGPSGRPDCESDSACKSVFMQAFQQSGQGNLDEALRLYQAAYELRADPVIHFSIARILHKQGRLTDATVYYQRFVDSPVDEHERKRKAQEYLVQIRALKQQRSSAGSSTPSLALPRIAPTVVPARTLGGAATDKPVSERWWFWSTIGGGALAIAAVGLGVGLSQQPPSLPADMNTYEPSF